MYIGSFTLNNISKVIVIHMRTTVVTAFTKAVPNSTRIEIQFIAEH